MKTLLLITIAATQVLAGCCNDVRCKLESVRPTNTHPYAGVWSSDGDCSDQGIVLEPGSGPHAYQRLQCSRDGCLDANEVMVEKGVTHVTPPLETTGGAGYQSIETVNTDTGALVTEQPCGNSPPVFPDESTATDGDVSPD